LSSSSRPFLLPLLSSLFPYTTLFRSAAHSRQHFYSSQLPLAHLRPPQSDLLSEVLLRGHFYRGQKGTLSSRRNTSNRPGRGCVLSAAPPKFAGGRDGWPALDWSLRGG